MTEPELEEYMCTLIEAGIDPQTVLWIGLTSLDYHIKPLDSAKSLRQVAKNLHIDAISRKDGMADEKYRGISINELVKIVTERQSKAAQQTTETSP